MKSKNKLLRLIGKNTPRYMVPYAALITAFVFLTEILLRALLNTSFMAQLVLARELVLSGQIWRIITFVFTFTGGSLSPFGMVLTILSYLFLYYISLRAVNQLGHEKINTFFVLSWLAYVIFAMLGVYTIGPVVLGTFFTFNLVYNLLFIYCILVADNGYGIQSSIINMVIALMLIIYSVTEILFSNRFGVVIAALFIYIFKDELSSVYRSLFNKPVRTVKLQAEKKIKARHKCAECDKTDLTHPDMTFRYCSKCIGDFEYCEEHIHNHEHRNNLVEFPKKKSDENSK